MRFSRFGLGLGLWAVIGYAAVACGGNDGGGSGPVVDFDPDTGSGNSGDACIGIVCPGPDANLDANGTEDQDSGVVPACAVTSATAQLPPINLVVMLDRSSSMGDPNSGGAPALSWNPVTNALEAFFADNGSAGMSAALTFFPNAVNSCSASDYYTPEVPLTVLPNDTAFTSAINSRDPCRLGLGLHPRRYRPKHCQRYLRRCQLRRQSECQRRRHRKRQGNNPYIRYWRRPEYCQSQHTCERGRHIPYRDQRRRQSSGHEFGTPECIKYYPR